MAHHITRLAAIASLGLVPALAGCSGPSVWQQSFVRAPDAVQAPIAKDAEVRVRSIPWERMGKTLAELEQQAAASDVHPSEWTSAQKLDAKARLLRGLQVSGDPTSIDVLGSCEFRSTDSIRPESEDQKSLAAFARSVGATDVVWSSRSLGKADKIIDKPVTSTSTGTFWGDRRRSDRDSWWSDNYTQNSTTWVPIRVQAEETGFVLYFLRTEPRR